MKILKVLAVSCAITIMSSFSAFADWEQVGTQWKYKDEVTDGYVASQWIESTTEKGLWYYLDENGVMAVNTTTPDGYYVNDKGEWRNTSGGNSSVSPGNQSHNQERINDFPVESGDFQFGDRDPSHWDTEGGTGSDESAWNFLHNR